MAGETFVSRNPLDYLELVSFDSVVAEDMGTQWGLIPCYLMYTQGLHITGMSNRVYIR